MIIDAMDILYTGKVDGFCIVSSDSDFTRLAIRLREAGMFVIGIGEKKTLRPFITACDKFIYIEILRVDEVALEEKEKTKSPKFEDQQLIKILKDSISDLADEDGWAFLGELGNMLLKKNPDFDSRNYGFSKMLPLIKSIQELEIDERETGKRNIKHVFVRIK